VVAGGGAATERTSPGFDVFQPLGKQDPDALFDE
jgi:hypothetical protein